MGGLDLILPPHHPIRPKPKAGQFIDPSFTAFAAVNGTTALTANNMAASPFWVDQPITVDQVAIEVTTNAGAGDTCLVGLGVFDPSTAWVVNLIASIFDADISANGAKTNAFAYTFVPGVIYAGLLLPEANVTVRGCASGHNIFGGQSATDTTVRNWLLVAHAHASGLPSTKTFTSSGVSAPKVMFRVA